MSSKKLGTTTRHLQLNMGANKDEERLELLQRLKAHTPNHRAYLKAIDSSKVTFCLGPAGTGKTWQAAGKASTMLVAGEIKRIVITRPMVSCGKDTIGFLPGDKDQKVGPYMLPLLDAFEDFLGSKTVDRLIETEVIVMSPLELMRGSNIRDAFIICDEAQNAEFVQLHMFLTRFAKGSKVVVTGDASQTDLKIGGQNPLLKVISIFRPGCHPDISIVTLDHGDTMRDELTSWIDRRLSGLEVVANPEQEEVPAEETSSKPEPFSYQCQWCEADCLVPEQLPKQFSCWSCSSLSSLCPDTNEYFRVFDILPKECVKSFEGTTVE